MSDSELPQLSPEELSNLPADGGPKYNRLVFEQSPYLLLHAANPIDWYPWGAAAFEKAAAENKPIFLSVGYATCHWCHVMARESFSDVAVAELMNAHFVAIKVDREERPDIDSVYMEVTQAMTGHGGWPNTVILTPEREPFFAGTYFPKEERLGRPGLLQVLEQIAGAWETRRDDLVRAARDATTFLREHAAPKSGEAPVLETLTMAYRQLADRYDAAHGGFGQAPKFPSPHVFCFLLRYWRRTREPRALEMAEHTLRSMRYGGIFDQVGFGFHRYATDRSWTLPHFEKMLYDQALLAIAYTETYQVTQNDFYAQTVRDIFTYVLRDMTSPDGGFYSAENADSEGEEGIFYLWKREEILSVLGEADGDLMARLFSVDEQGNFREEATGQRTGRNILYLGEPIETKAERLNMPVEALKAKVSEAQRKLFEVRERRVRPLRDDKVLTDWNGLMIAALAKAGRALNEPAYTAAAERAAAFVLTRLRQENGRLLHRYRQGQAALPAHLEDYAYLVWALIELYEATFKVSYLSTAKDLAERQIAEFWDPDEGGFFQTSENREDLLFRPKEAYDGALPSGNSVSALNLLRLGRMTAARSWEERAGAIMKAFGQQIAQAPSAYAQLMCALDFGFGPSYEVVIAGRLDQDDTNAMIQALASRFLPNKVVLFRPTDEEHPPIAAVAEFTAYQTGVEGKATAYVCRNYACSAPTTNIRAMIESLEAERL